MRVLITGGPQTGKTTLSNNATGYPIRHTDDLISMPWSDQSEEIAKWFCEPGPWVIEGVAIVRSLRKWLRTHPQGLPFDHLIYLSQPVLALGQWRQVALATATSNIWNEIYPSIEARLSSSGPIIDLR